MKSFKPIAAILLAVAMMTSVCACLPKAPTKPTSTSTKTTTTTSTKSTSTTSTSKTTSSTSKTQESEWDYTWLDDNTIMVTKYKGTSSKVTVPSEINGTAVTAVGSWTFRENTKLEEVVIPDSVTRIKQNLFMNCINLKKVTLPKKVEEFGDQIFEGCTSIQRVVVPDGVTELVYREFAGCAELFEVVIPPVSKIDSAVFAGCTKLERIYYLGYQDQWLECEIGGNAFPKDITIDVIFNDWTYTKVTNPN